MKLLDEATDDDRKQHAKIILQVAMDFLAKNQVETKSELIGLVRNNMLKSSLKMQNIVAIQSKLTEEERWQIIVQDSISDLFVTAIIDLIADGNTIWDDDQLLLAQFCNRIKKLVMEAYFRCPKTGKTQRVFDQ